MAKKTKEERTRERKIKAEKARLHAIIEPLGEEIIDSSVTLIDNLAFLRVSMDEVKSILNKEGMVEHWDNGGGQTGRKESSYFKVYNNLLQRFTPLSKQFLDLLPKQVQQEVSDGFEEHLRNRPQ